MTDNTLGIDILDIPVGKDKVFSREEIIIIATSSAELRDRALFVSVYLSNSRISEIVKRLKKRDIKFLDVEGKPIMLFAHLYTSKNRQHPERNVPVNIDKERPLVDILRQYLDNYNDDAILFDIGRIRAYQILKKLCGKNPHYLRHSRLTHLITEYGLSESMLKNMAGWTDTRQAAVYVHLGYKDIVKVM